MTSNLWGGGLGKKGVFTLLTVFPYDQHFTCHPKEPLLCSQVLFPSPRFTKTGPGWPPACAALGPVPGAEEAKGFMDTWAVCPVVCSFNSPRPSPGTTCYVVDAAGRVPTGPAWPSAGVWAGAAWTWGCSQVSTEAALPPGQYSASAPAAPALGEAVAWRDSWEVVPHTHLSVCTWMPYLQISCRSLKFTYNSQVNTVCFHSPLRAAEQQSV